MARALKTYVTHLGFFELAIAAPSMKAALEAWGMSHNAFAHGFARQSDDPAIIAATLAHPGLVLKRAVGSSGDFTLDAALPKSLPNIQPPVHAKTKAKPKPASAARKPLPRAAKPVKCNPAAILSFEKARRERDRAQARQEAKAAKARALRDRATHKAQAALEKAQAAHRKIMDEIDAARTALDRRAEKESARWDSQREKLDRAVTRARND